jgi:hypothetical protein
LDEADEMLKMGFIDDIKWVMERIPVTINGSISAGNTTMDVVKKKGTPIRFAFGLVKKNLTFLEHRRIKARLKRAEAMVNKAAETGQVALSEQAFTAWEVLLKETQIYGANFKYFIDEPLLDKFIASTDPNKNRRNAEIHVTPVAEFTRLIPAGPQKKLDKARKLELFDEIVVVHHDPELNSVSEKEKKKIKREKDPILFGKINNCNRLYFIDDWEDEYCDLTFDDIVDRLDLEEEGIVLTKDPKFNLPGILKEDD